MVLLTNLILRPQAVLHCLSTSAGDMKRYMKLSSKHVVDIMAVAVKESCIELHYFALSSNRVISWASHLCLVDM